MPARHRDQAAALLIIVTILLATCTDPGATAVPASPAASPTAQPIAAARTASVEMDVAASSTPTAGTAATPPPAKALPTPTAEPTVDPASIGGTLARLEGLPLPVFLEVSYEALLLRSPETVTAYGLSEAYGVRNDRLDDLSDAYQPSSSPTTSTVGISRPRWRATRSSTTTIH
jgi:hypothetical protein